MTDRLTDERKAEIEAKLQAAAPGLWEPQALHELLAEVERLRVEVEAAKRFGGGFYGDQVDEGTRDVYRQRATP